MIHPSTRLVHINNKVGYGVVASDLIPMGTITYVRDDMEIILESSHRLHFDERYRQFIEKYSYTEFDGTKVLSWDIAKYVNHSCDCNTLSTGYGFEIAIRDIYPNEQLTDDYGMFNIEEEMSCLCGSSYCRNVIGRNEFSHNAELWDRKVRRALSHVEAVSQPLMEFMDQAVLAELKMFVSSRQNYRSVNCLQKSVIREVAV